jgi:uncharacterized damage-inducible protein DinB
MHHLRTLIDHMAWADDAALRSLRQPDVPQRALDLYAHVLGAEHVWLARLEQRSPSVAVWPEGSVVLCERLARENQQAFRVFVEQLDDAGRRRAVRYRNSAGQEFESVIEDILLHVAMHGSYHRGQVALLVRDAGLEPQPTDFIAFVRGAPAATSATPLRPPAQRR